MFYRYSKMKFWTALVYLIIRITAIENSDEEITVTSLDNLLLSIRLEACRIIYTKHSFNHYADLSEIIRQADALNNAFIQIGQRIVDVNNSNENPISYHSASNRYRIVSLKFNESYY
ncbi:hypothetical protein WA026_023783 [Henosepilachna vigintioctopunctata]|uniref:Uncharacterized protein n=1 Tax=Henosepilachna vigintioctopunctata TaxID=420089 RepID=A0AAW1V4K3_9CUCU